MLQNKQSSILIFYFEFLFFTINHIQFNLGYLILALALISMLKKSQKSQKHIQNLKAKTQNITGIKMQKNEQNEQDDKQQQQMMMFQKKINKSSKNKYLTGSKNKKRKVSGQDEQFWDESKRKQIFKFLLIAACCIVLIKVIGFLVIWNRQSKEIIHNLLLKQSKNTITKETIAQIDDKFHREPGSQKFDTENDGKTLITDLDRKKFQHQQNQQLYQQYPKQQKLQNQMQKKQIQKQTPHQVLPSIYYEQSTSKIHSFSIQLLKSQSNLQKFQQKAGITKEKFQTAIDKLILPNVLNYHQKKFIQKIELEFNEKSNSTQNILKQDLSYISDTKIKQLVQNQLDYYQNKYYRKQNVSLAKEIKNVRYCVVITPKQATQEKDLNMQQQKHLSVNEYYKDQYFLGKRTLKSIFMQNYQNYHIVYAAFPRLYQSLIQFLKTQKIPEQKIIVTQIHLQKAENIFRAIHQECKTGQVAALINEGDSLVGRQVFNVINHHYQSQNKPNLVYTQSLIFHEIGEISLGSSNEYRQKILQKAFFRNLRKLFSSPLQTFYVDMFLRIAEPDLQTRNNKYFDKAYAQAIMFPILEMSNPKIVYIDEIMYEVFDRKGMLSKQKQTKLYRSQMQYFSQKRHYQAINNTFLTQNQEQKIKQIYQHFAQKSDERQKQQQAIKKQINQTQKVQSSQSFINQALIDKQNNQVKTAQKLSKSEKNQQLPKSKFNSSEQVSKNLYEFENSMQQMLKWGKQNFVQNVKGGITIQQFEFAIKRLWMNHNFNRNGQIIENSLSQQKQTQNKLSQQLLFNISFEQNQYFNNQYQTQKYYPPISPSQSLINFCIVVPSYNNFQNNLYLRNIDSIFMQEYPQENFHVIYIDDHSSDQTGENVNKYLKLKLKLKLKENQNQNINFNVIINQENKGAMEVIYNAITKQCKDGEVVVMLDGDDSFVGRQVLKVLNAVFQKQKVALLYTQHVKIQDNFKVQVGVSHSYQPQVLQNNSFRSLQDARYSHLKAFYVDLFKKIQIKDLTYDGRIFFKAASDTAMMKPMLEMANPRLMYLPQILYEYRYDTGINGNLVHKEQQHHVKKIIEKGRKYTALNSFQFIK